MDKRAVKEVHQKVFSYYQQFGRHDLPWRRTTDRYAILVSEVMLQQTQVDRVIPKFNAWMQAFPSVQALADASLADVLRLWSGLGYNSRAKRLQDAAKVIVEQYAGIVPRSPDELIALPGIGPYTANSVLIFADNVNLATVDTNIRRIFIHELGLPESLSDKELFFIAKEVLPKGRSRDWHNALMDYGATLLTARKSGIRPKSKQSKFVGSKRFFRGRLLKFLVTNKKATLKDVAVLFVDCQHDKEEIVAGLVADGLVECKGESLILKR